MSGYYPVQRPHIRELHYIAPLDNLDSIFERGILSHNEAEPYKRADISMDGVQHLRATKEIPAHLMGVAKVIHACVNLYFNGKNPMLSKRRDEKDALCVLRIKPEVLQRNGAVVSDQNAATSEARFYAAAEGVDRLATDVLFGEYWTSKYNTEEQNRINGQKRSAELLLPKKLHPSYIGGMYVASERVRQAVLAKFPSGCPVQVTVHPSFFFEKAGTPYIPPLANSSFPTPVDFPEETLPYIPPPQASPPIQGTVEEEGLPHKPERRVSHISRPVQKSSAKRQASPRVGTIDQLFSEMRAKQREAQASAPPAKKRILPESIMADEGPIVRDEGELEPVSSDDQEEDRKTKKARQKGHPSAEERVISLEEQGFFPESRHPPLTPPRQAAAVSLAPSHYTSPQKGLDKFLVRQGTSPTKAVPYQFRLEIPPHIRFISGDLLGSRMQTLVNTVNCKGAMGKGIALQFKKRYPGMFADYKSRCERKEVKPGRPYPYPMEGKLIINFPTKDDWRKDSSLHWISQGLDEIVKNYKEWGITSLAIPPLGCGNGGLDWRTVRKIMIDKLSALPQEIEIEIYNPDPK